MDTHFLDIGLRKMPMRNSSPEKKPARSADRRPVFVKLRKIHRVLSVYRHLESNQQNL